MRLKEKIAGFFMDQGFKIILAGFAISAAGIIMYMQAQHQSGIMRKVAFGIAAAGIGVYVIGRIGIIAQQRRARRLHSKALEGSQEKETA
jgi:hypothetical protein